MKKGKKSSKDNQARQSAKKAFIVGENETIDACLDRMKKEGYQPIMRTSRPIFREGKSGPEVIGRHCVIEGRLSVAKGEQ
ncbi:NETI motif-containing protein [Sporolactobacillus shoreae]|uniref:NETI motif-containing protein n=1 Tax=Sporolactobacillus shoreae TaxID=1465501 RepID=A0A4Z0GLR2_9BACL|nr:NETI motif-containing protein [Sporolactobacillus shoreae]TGA96644.1 NETI motif-containing protein [Sporolactobacillus shoreae]